MNMIRNIVTLTAATIVSLTLSMAAQAEQRVVQTPAGEKVVHTRLAPVLLHRAVPPYLGKHVYQGRMTR
jgi:hypothetical protein